MKKFFLLFLLTLTAVVSEAKKIDGIRYELMFVPGTLVSKGTVTVAGSDVYGNLVIPSSVDYSSRNTYSVVQIYEDAFKKCTDLISIVIPNTVTEIQSDAFKKCTNLEKVVIGEGIIKIGGDAFAGCTSLRSLTIMSVKPPKLRDDVFKDVTNCVLYVPAEAVDTYKNSNLWGNMFEVKAIETE